MIEELKKYGDLLENENLSNHTTYKLGGKTRYLFRPNSIDNLVEAIKYLEKENINYFILGNGSNLIIVNDYFDGVVIKLDLLKNYKIDEENLILDVEAGAYMPLLANKLAKEGYSTLSWAGGLPGSIGGSIYGNAEAYKKSISDSLIDVTVFKDNEIKVLKKEDIKFSYRSSQFKEGDNSIILSARIKLEKKDKEEIQEKMKKRNQKRLSTQPLEYPSAGSTFRNPHISDYKDIFEKYSLPVNENGFVSSGYLIEQCGLKGTQIGGAQISEKHANFIINKDNATSEDVINLIKLAKDKVKEKYEINLVLEQEVIDLSKER